MKVLLHVAHPILVLWVDGDDERLFDDLVVVVVLVVGL